MTRSASPYEQISNAENKRVEVRAAPGSGKTYTAVKRVQYLLRSGVPAKQILILTFSNGAVRQMRHRLREFNDLSSESQVCYSDTQVHKVMVSTTHAFALSLIKKQRVLDEKSACDLLKATVIRARRQCKSGELWPDATSDVRRRRLRQLTELAEPPQISRILRLIEVARASKKTLVETSEMPQFSCLGPYVKVLRIIRAQYSAIKKQRKVIDYGDMLTQALAAIRDGIAVPFSHILVDEYQDCSSAQTHLLAALANLNDRSIMVFGDAHQSIYGFSGSSYIPLRHVLDDVHEMSLPISRRLTAQTAALASAVAQHQQSDAIQTNKKGKSPLLIQHDTLSSQTQHIVQHIKKLIESGTEPEQIAVVARMKALLSPVEQLLLSQHVLTKRIGLKRERKHALRVLRLVRMVERCAQPNSEITPEMLRSALPHLKGKNNSLWKQESRALKKVSSVPSLEGKYKLCAKTYLRLNGGVRENPALRADVNRWEPLCRAYSDALAMRTVIRAMEKKAVVTGTIHSAKGGEWDHIVIVGATDGLLPLYLSRDSDQSLSEERNLLYVAITRARETVRLYHAPANHARSRQQFNRVSRFLDVDAVRKMCRVLNFKKTMLN